MKIGIFADSHDHVDHVIRAVEVFNAQAVELVVFAGDFVSPIVIPPLRKLNCPMLASFGDNEGNQQGVQAGMRIVGPVGYPPFGFQAGDGTKILVTHVLSQVQDCLGEADVVIFAHTHRASLQRDEADRLYINPGETSGWTFRKPSVAILETATRSVEFLSLLPEAVTRGDASG